MLKKRKRKDGSVGKMFTLEAQGSEFNSPGFNIENPGVEVWPWKPPASGIETRVSLAAQSSLISKLQAS